MLRMVTEGGSTEMIANDICNTQRCLYCLTFGETCSIFKMFLNKHDQSVHTPESLGQTTNQSEQILPIPEHIQQVPTLPLGRELPSSSHLPHDAKDILKPRRFSQPDSLPALHLPCNPKENRATVSFT